MPISREALLDTAAAAQFLGLSVKTLEHYRNRKVGPQYARLACNRVRYQLADLQRFVESRLVKPETANIAA